MPPTALTRAKPKILGSHRWLALITMAVNGYTLWMLGILRRSPAKGGS